MSPERDILLAPPKRFPVYVPNWEGYAAYCVLTPRGRSVVVSHSSQDTVLRSTEDLIELLEQREVTFFCGCDQGLEASLSLSGDRDFVTKLSKDGRGRYNGTLFEWSKFPGGEQRLKVRRGRKLHYLIDVSKLAIDGSGRALPLSTGQAVQKFVDTLLDYVSMQEIDFGTNISFSRLLQNLYLKRVRRAHLPDWRNPRVLEIQVAFRRHFVGPHHEMAVRGPDMSMSLDRVNSHLGIIENCPCTCLFCNNVHTQPYYSREAAHGCYTVIAPIPHDRFTCVPVEIRPGHWSYVYGPEVPMKLLKPHLDAMIELYGSSWFERVKILEAVQLIPKREFYRDQEVCRSIRRLIEDSPRGISLKALYQRVGGKFCSAYLIGETETTRTYQLGDMVDYVAAGYIRAVEAADTWRCLMQSRNSQYRRIDGSLQGDFAGLSPPSEEAEVLLWGTSYHVTPLKLFLGISDQYKDKPGETYYRDEILKNPQAENLAILREAPYSLHAVLEAGLPLDLVGLPRPTFWKPPSSTGRKFPPIKYAGDYLERVVGEMRSYEEALAEEES